MYDDVKIGTKITRIEWARVPYSGLFLWVLIIHGSLRKNSQSYKFLDMN